MVVPVELTEEDVETVKRAIGVEGYYDWTDSHDVGEAIRDIIQNPLKEMV
ncbi:MAG: hypothetical protein J6M06_01895 [Synergistaceae bacterium]|nr:hypothetical protein [Synergistaceae bacterium]